MERTWGYEIPSLHDIYRIGQEGHFDGTCMETVPWAIRCFLDSENFEDAIRNAVLADGDTDTKANITGALAEAFYVIPPDIAARSFSYLPIDMLDIVLQYYDEIGQILF